MLMNLHGIETDVLFFVMFVSPFLAALAYRYRFELGEIVFRGKRGCDADYWGAYGTSQR